MTKPSREYRQPPPISAVGGFFCSLEISGWSSANSSGQHNWYRIVPDQHARSFHASAGSRFTPASGQFPCAYFAVDPQTCFAELQGDAMARHAHAQPQPLLPFVITASYASARGLYRLIQSPDLCLCDLTDAATLLSLHLDLATVYALDLKLTRDWAEFITQLDSQTCKQLRGAFDGIRYLSRHTGKLCQVIWDRPDQEPVSTRMDYERESSLHNATFAFDVAKLCGTKLSFANDATD